MRTKEVFTISKVIGNIVSVFLGEKTYYAAVLSDGSLASEELFHTEQGAMDAFITYSHPLDYLSKGDT